MYKSIFSLLLSFLLVCLVGFTTPGQAQITVNSSGNAAIGAASPSSTYKLRVEYSLGGGTRVGVRGASSSGANANYGVQGIASNGFVNYGIYGSAFDGFSHWAGYFNGNVYTTGSYQSSDERLKTNIRLLDTESISAKILQLEPLRYEFRSDEELRNSDLPSMHAKPGDHFGLIAQDLEKVFPELVTDVVHVLEEETGEIREDSETVTTKAINYQELTVVLLAAVQELQERVQSLEQELDRR